MTSMLEAGMDSQGRKILNLMADVVLSYTFCRRAAERCCCTAAARVVTVFLVVATPTPA